MAIDQGAGDYTRAPGLALGYPRVASARRHALVTASSTPGLHASRTGDSSIAAPSRRLPQSPSAERSSPTCRARRDASCPELWRRPSRHCSGPIAPVP